MTTKADTLDHYREQLRLAQEDARLVNLALDSLDTLPASERLDLLQRAMLDMAGRDGE
jgi:hypothetical protein